MTNAPIDHIKQDLETGAITFHMVDKTQKHSAGYGSLLNYRAFLKHQMSIVQDYLEEMLSKMIVEPWQDGMIISYKVKVNTLEILMLEYHYIDNTVRLANGKLLAKVNVYEPDITRAKDNIYQWKDVIVSNVDLLVRKVAQRYLMEEI